MSFTWLAGMLALIPVDYAWTVWLRKNRVRWLDHWMDQTLFEGEGLGGGDPVILFLIVVVFFYYLTWKKNSASRLIAWRPHLGFILVSAITTSVLMVHSLKWIMGRARPSLVMRGLQPFSDWFEFGPHFITEGTYRGSLPSGHTAQVFTLMALAYVLLLAIPKFKSQNLLGWLWGSFTLLYTLLMALSRCMKLSHWVSDVLFSLGFSWILMHLIYYILLRIPEQEDYFHTHGQFPQLPAVWELRLCLLLFLMVLSAMALVLGVRAIFLSAAWPLQGLLPISGICGLCYFGLRIRKGLNTIRSAFRQPPQEPQILTSNHSREPI
jgi:membrane-associated phospholipid phosphatase